MSIKRARTLRQQSTDAETRLWSRLRDRQIGGFKFRRQVPVGPYVADFVCYDRKLIVELDGGQHAARVKEDAARTEWLNKAGFRVIRYWNNEVLENTEGVLEAILIALGE